MDASWGAKFPPQVIILLCVLVFVGITTAVILIVLQNREEKMRPAIVILSVIFIVVHSLTLVILSSLFILSSPISPGDPSVVVDFPLPSISAFESEHLLDPTPTPDSAPASTSVPTPTQSADSLTVFASYEYISFADANALIQARTTVAATHVVISWSNMDGRSDSRQMHSMDNTNWTFFANFFEPGTFVITITAYGENGQTASTVFNVLSPVG